MNRPRVLLADDNRAVAKALRSLLCPDFDVTVVEDGQALVAAAPEQRPDVIVADISMPRVDGLAALAQLKKKDPNVKVVFISIYQDPAFARSVLDAGAFGFVLKHSAAEELVAAVRAALNGKTYLSLALARDR